MEVLLHSLKLVELFLLCVTLTQCDGRCIELTVTNRYLIFNYVNTRDIFINCIMTTFKKTAIN